MFSPSTKCFYPSLSSIEERLNLVEQEQLGGVGIWELGQGLNDFTTLL
jgi:spore germination protein YaaH